MLSIVLAIGCRDPLPSQYAGFFELLPTRQRDSIVVLPVETRLDLVVLGLTKFEPPLMYLIDPVAKGGRPVAVAAGRRMATVGRIERSALLHLLAWVNCFHYDIASDSSTLTEVRAQFALTQFGSLQDRARENMGLIDGTRACAVGLDTIKNRFRPR